MLWGNEFLCPNGYVVDWAVVSANGHSAIAVLPPERWETNYSGTGLSTPGCRVSIPVATSAVAFDNLAVPAEYRVPA